jgi:hypothetical protein
MSHGATPTEALQNLREVTELYISVLKEKGLEIPPPRGLEDFVVNPLSSESDIQAPALEVVQRQQCADMSPDNLHIGMESVRV